MRLISKLLILFIAFSLGLGVGSTYIHKNQSQAFSQVEKNTPKAFISEVYDKIKDNYWDNITDAQLLELFRLSIKQNGGGDLSKLENKEQLLKAVNASLRIPEIVSSVLTTLSPKGRLGLYTQKAEQQLQNTVNNVNPQNDLYKNLGLNKGASVSAVADAFSKKSEELKKENTPQAKEQLKQITYAKDVLVKDDTKLRYDTSQVEPTIFTRVLGGQVLYLQFKKFSPTSLDEFVKAFDNYKDSNLTALIFDLRGNIGGVIDVTPYFLGLFLGKNQYAFDFYHKGEYMPFRTPTDKLPSIAKYKQIILLIDNNTQSSAEIMAASFKKYHLGVVVGTKTHGWGTVERVFPLDNQISKTEKYSLFLVHSITLRDDNQPIEGRGVDPDISLKDSDWERKLSSYFGNSQLVMAVKDAI